MTDSSDEIIRRGFQATSRGDRGGALAFLDPDVEIRTETQANASRSRPAGAAGEAASS